MKKPAKKILKKKPIAKKKPAAKKVATKKSVVRKPTAKKIVKKPVKLAKKAIKKIAKPAPAQKPIGSVLHFYNHLKVAVVKFKQDMKVGAPVAFKGATTDFKGVISSIQVDHEPKKLAKKGAQVGIKVQKKVRQGDLIFPVAAK